MKSAGSLDWLLDDLVTRVPLIEKAVILSRDGLPIGTSSGIGGDDAAHLSAVAAGFQSLARGFGRHFGSGNPRQTIVELDSAFLFVTDAGEGSCLAVLATVGADAGLVAYEMTVLVKRVGQHLNVRPRPAQAPAAESGTARTQPLAAPVAAAAPQARPQQQGRPARPPHPAHPVSSAKSAK